MARDNDLAALLQDCARLVDATPPDAPIESIEDVCFLLNRADDLARLCNQIRASQSFDRRVVWDRMHQLGLLPLFHILRDVRAIEQETRTPIGNPERTAECSAQRLQHAGRCLQRHDELLRALRPGDGSQP